MTFEELVRTRRSVRDFRPDPVGRSTVEALVDLARWAPSAFNAQDTRFFAAEGETLSRVKAIAAIHTPQWVEPLRGRLPDELLTSTERFFATLGGAPVALFVYAPMGGPAPQAAYASACAAVQTFLLAAHHRGLASTWMQTLCDVQTEVDAALGADRGLTLVAALPLGYPAQRCPTPKRRNKSLAWVG